MELRIETVERSFRSSNREHVLRGVRLSLTEGALTFTQLLGQTRKVLRQSVLVGLGIQSGAAQCGAQKTFRARPRPSELSERALCCDPAAAAARQTSEHEQTACALGI